MRAYSSWNINCSSTVASRPPYSFAIRCTTSFPMPTPVPRQPDIPGGVVPGEADAAVFGELAHQMLGQPSANLVAELEQFGREVEIHQDALDQRSGAHASADAHRHQAVASARSLQLVQALGQQHATRRTEWMSQCDCAAVGIHVGQIGFHLMGPSQHDGGERLVDLDDVDIAEREVIALEDLLGGRDRAGQHHHRVIADQHRIHHARAGRRSNVAHRSAAINSSADAPSEICDDVPAVCRAPGRSFWLTFSPASPSRVVGRDPRRRRRSRCR